MAHTKVKSVMTRNPVLISSNATLKDAAEKMLSIDCGVLPVGEGDTLQGMITDRDIVIRAVAKGKDVTKEKVEHYMTQQVFVCHEDDTLEESAEEMCKHQVSRLIVKDGNEEITGILSFGCMLRKNENAKETARVVECAVKKQAA